MNWRSAYVTAMASGAFLASPRSAADAAFCGGGATSAAWTTVRRHQELYPQQQGRYRLKRESAAVNALGMVGGMGWDNDNFLDALGRGDDALSKANQEYEALSRFGRRPAGDNDENDGDAFGSARKDDDLPSGNSVGAVLTDEMKAQMRAAHGGDDDDSSPASSQGGQMFREMMARVQQGRTLSSGSAPQYVPPPPPPSQPASAGLPNLDSLTVEQQAELFRQMMAGQQPGLPPPQAIDPTSLPRRPSGGGADPNRRPGRNRDADTIVNSSDVYFAQLKLDSTLRNYARYGGDEDKANQVFADPKIHEIKVHVNPYLEEMRRKEAEMIETAADEMLVVAPGGAPGSAERTKSYAGPSYRDRLQQKKKKPEQQGVSGSPAAGGPAASIAPPSAAAASAAPPGGVAAPPEKVAVAASPLMSTPTSLPPPQVSPAAIAEAQTAEKPTSVAAASPASAAANPGSAPPPPTGARAYVSEDELRGDIRTFMGLLLKHRGGPGFGSGRLKTLEEKERFEALSRDILDHLRNEASLAPSAASPPSSPDNSHSDPVSPSMFSSTSSSTTTPQAMQPPLPAAPAASSAPSSSLSSEIPDPGRAQSMIMCIEGGIQMYRNSPPELRESVVAVFRSALVSALNTVTELLPPGAPAVPPSPPPASSDLSQPTQDGEARISGTIALIEGAIVMYKNSPPELHSSILVTLRGALLSGIGTLNGVIAENEAKNLKSYQQQQPTASSFPPSTATAPGEYYDVIPIEQAAPGTPPPTSRSATQPPEDSNSQFFERVHAKLQQAKGDGIMGLRPDMDAASATDLADDLSKMRSLLVKELEVGIGGGTGPSSSATAASPSSSSAASRYQDMLAKARAEKEGLQ